MSEIQMLRRNQESYAANQKIHNTSSAKYTHLKSERQNHLPRWNPCRTTDVNHHDHNYLASRDMTEPVNNA